MATVAEQLMGLLSQPTPLQKAKQTFQTEGANMAGLLKGGPAAVGAYNAPQMAADIAGSVQNIFGVKRPQSLQQTIASNPEMLETPEGLLQLADQMQTSNPQAASQLTLMAQTMKEKQKTEQQAQLQQAQQRSTTLAYIEDMAASVEDPALKAQLMAITRPVASGAMDDADKVGNLIEKMFERSGTEMPKASVKDFVFPGNKAELTLRVNEQGMVYYAGKWQDPSSLGLTQAPTRTAARNTEDQTEQWARNVEPLLQWAATMKLLPEGDSNTNPIIRSFVQAVERGQVTDEQRAKEWLADMPGTPAFDTKQRDIKVNGLRRIAVPMNNIQEVRAILDDPSSSVGGWRSFYEDWALMQNRDQARLAQALLPIASDAALAQIQVMKEQAAMLGGEGTGLGQVAVKEFEALQNSVENIRSARTQEDLQDAIADYELHLANTKMIYVDGPIIYTMDDPVFGGMEVKMDDDGKLFVEVAGSAVEVMPVNSTAEGIRFARQYRP